MCPVLMQFSIGRLQTGSPALISLNESSYPQVSWEERLLNFPASRLNPDVNS